MSAIILRAELIETRKALVSCPRGIAGRVHAIRVRRHFHPSRKLHQSLLVNAWGFTRKVHSQEEQHTDENVHSSHLQQQQGDIGQKQLNEFSKESFHSLKFVSTQTQSRLSERSGQRKWHRSIDAGISGLEFPGTKSVLGRTSGDREEQIERFYGHLRHGDPNIILQQLLSATTIKPEETAATPIIGGLPPNMFSEVLRSLDPEGLVGPQLRILGQVSPMHPVYLGSGLHHRKTGFYRICNVFMNRIQTIVEARRANGFSLSSGDYKYLLRCARAVGNQNAAENIWKRMRKEQILPDTECYNHYMASKVWSDLVNPLQRFHLQIIPQNMEKRNGVRNSSHQAYKGHSTGVGGIKFQMTRLFNQMVQNGRLGDEETFCLMMVAFGREGDMESVQSILSRVWGLDVPALMALKEASLSSMRMYSLGSALRPSDTLLLTIAHIYGINNQIQQALRLVDFISRQNSLEISTSVWEELLEWTYVLSLRRPAKIRELSGSISPFSPRAVLELWDAMTAEPYNVVPTMSMYDKVIMASIRMHRFVSAQQIIERGRTKHIQLVSQYGAILSAIDQQKSLFQDKISVDFSETEEASGRPIFHRLAQLKRQATHEYLILHRSRQYLRKWCRIFIQQSARKHSDGQFGVQGLQDFQRSFHLFLPKRIKYDTPTGSVEMFSGSFQTNRARVKSYHQRRFSRAHDDQNEEADDHTLDK